MKKLFSILLCSVVIMAVGCAKEEDGFSSIIFFIGDVKINNAEAEIGKVILQNDVITTGGDSSCDIKIGGSIVRIKEKSKMLI